MNFARVGLAALAAWVASIPVGYVVNEVLLAGVHGANAAALRPAADVAANVPFAYLFMLVGFLVFAYAYAKGYEGSSGAVEGLRFGVIVALLVDCFVVSWWWATVPIDWTMAGAMMADYVVELSLYGAIVGVVYKPLPGAA
ncbi:MAG: hypothetical protein FJW23_02690 [Acidimicrobiia bacterium]|nr:hypothetical protein [Acidimicrobiia bacterium]